MYVIYALSIFAAYTIFAQLRYLYRAPLSALQKGVRRTRIVSARFLIKLRVACVVLWVSNVENKYQGIFLCFLVFTCI